MYNLWLIQRGLFRKEIPEEITGVDSIINWAYMGSAEFEFGELPKSLKRIIIAGYGQYEFVEIKNIKDKEGNTARVYCKSSEIEDAKFAVKHLSKNDYGYKECANMASYIKNGYDGKYMTADFWWDIKNDFFVLFGDEKQALLEKAITALETKWDAAPKPVEKKSIAAEMLLQMFKQKEK